MPEAGGWDPTTLGAVIASVLGALGIGTAGGQRLAKGSLSDEDRALLQALAASAGQLEQRLAALEQQAAFISSTVAGHREENAGSRRVLDETRAQLGRLAEEARPVLEGWRREQERLGAIERKGDERKAVEEETARQVRALHERMDALREQLREQLPPGLTAALEGLISSATALRVAIEDRVPRRTR